MASELFKTMKSVENNLTYSTSVSGSDSTLSRVSASGGQKLTELLCDRDEPLPNRRIARDVKNVPNEWVSLRSRGIRRSTPVAALPSEHQRS